MTHSRCFKTKNLKKKKKKAQDIFDVSNTEEEIDFQKYNETKTSASIKRKTRTEIGGKVFEIIFKSMCPNSVYADAKLDQVRIGRGKCKKERVVEKSKLISLMPSKKNRKFEKQTDIF